MMLFTKVNAWKSNDLELPELNDSFSSERHLENFTHMLKTEVENKVEIFPNL